MAVQSGKKRGKRRKRNNLPIILVCIIGLIAVAFLVFGLVKLFSKKPEEVSTELESELSSEVTVDGIDISGLMESEARNRINEKYKWKMTVVLSDGRRFEIPNLLESSINKVLDDIYDPNTPTKSSYSIDLKADEQLLDSELAAIREQCDIAPKNGAISGYDEASGAFSYSGAENGISVNGEKLRKDILSAVAGGIYSTDIQAETVVVEPDITEEKAKELYKTIGSYVTKSTANADRNNNLNLACKAVNGIILQPGEEFSFNLTTGNRTVEKGYKAAGAYLNGELVEEPGGGVCQVASTLYNALVFSGLEITERHAHTFEPTYVTPGEDATVSYDGYSGPDLKFINTTSSAIVILAHYADQTVKCSVIGIPVLEEGVTVSMHSEKDESYQPEIAPVVYEEDYTLPPHTEVEVQKGDQGSRWTTYLVTHKADGSETSELLHTTTYKGHTPKIKRNETDYQLDEEGNVVASSFADETEPPAIQPGPGNTTENIHSHLSSEAVTIAPFTIGDDYDEDDFIPDEPDPISPAGPGSFN